MGSPSAAFSSHRRYVLLDNFEAGMAGNVEEMKGFCQNLVKDGCPGVEHALVSLIELFVRHGRLNEAICVLVNMRLGGYQPSINVFNVILGALIEERRGFENLVFVYKEMVKAGVAPVVDTLNYLLEALFENGKVNSALDQYRRIKKKGCSPNSRTFEIVIKCLILNNQVDDSMVILDEMLELRFSLESSFYTCIIPLFCRENKLVEALRVFRMMRTSNFVPNSFIYEALIQCLCKNIQLDDAVKLVEEMIENNFTPNKNVLVDVVNGFCKLGKINDAAKLLEDKQVLKTSPHNALLEGCCNVDKFFVAKGLLEKMSERSIADCDSWNILIRWLCKKAEIRKACELLGRMFVSSLVPSSATYSALVVGLCRLRMLEDALQLFLQFQAKCWVLDSLSYHELIEGLCRVEKHLEATEVFQYMFANRCFLQSHPLSLLIKCNCKKGMVNAAVRLKQMAYDSVLDSNVYNILVKGLWKEGHKNEACQLLDSMLEKNWVPDADTHRLLIGSVDKVESGEKMLTYENSTIEDNVLEILTEGLGKT